jgi:gephyrin
VIANIIPHAVDLILNNKETVTMTHSNQNNIHHNCFLKKSEVSLNLCNIVSRHRESPYPLISLEESQKILKNSVTDNIPSVQIKIWESFGRVLAETVYSPRDIPPFNASVKDGYAVIAKDGKGKRKVLCGLEAGHNVSKY